MKKNPKWTSWLAATPLFEGLADKAIENALEAAVCKPLRKSEILFHEGDSAAMVYLVHRGRVKLAQVNEEGEEIILRYIGPGELMALVAVLKGRDYPAAAIVVQEGQAFCWEGRILRDLMLRYPGIALNALDIVSGRLLEFQERYREQTTERVERRVAKTLLRLTRRAGRRVAEGVLIDFPLTRQDIAELSGTTLYSVSRILSAWEKRGWVKSGREKVVLCNLHELVALGEELS